MLHYAVVFLVIAVVCAALGFGALTGLAATLAKVCFALFVIAAIISFLKKKA